MMSRKKSIVVAFACLAVTMAALCLLMSRPAAVSAESRDMRDSFSLKLQLKDLVPPMLEGIGAAKFSVTNAGGRSAYVVSRLRTYRISAAGGRVVVILKGEASSDSFQRKLEASCKITFALAAEGNRLRAEQASVERFCVYDLPAELGDGDLVQIPRITTDLVGNLGLTDEVLEAGREISDLRITANDEVELEVIR